MINGWSTLFFILILASWASLFGGEPIDLQKLRDKINMYDNAGAYHLVIEHAKNLYSIAAGLPRDSVNSEFRSDALMFQLDRYKGSNPNLYEETFKVFEREYHENHAKSVGTVFSYYIYKYGLHKLQDDYKAQLLVLDEAEKYLIKHSRQMDHQSFVFRKMLVYYRRGDVYLKENNYSLARIQYELARSVSKEVDALHAELQNMYFDYERLQLINLFKLAVFSNDIHSIHRIYIQLHKKRKKSFYENTWNHELIQALLYGNNIPIQQMKAILPQLASNELLKKDPLSIIKISQYFLDNNLPSEAEFYKEKAQLLLPLFSNSLQTNVEYNLLCASIALKRYNLLEMDSLIKSSKKLLVDIKKASSAFNIRGSRKDYLTFMQKATALYNQAYKKSGDRSLLLQCATLTDEAINTLYYLRLDLPDESDRTLLLTQLTDLCERALFNYSELFKISKPTKDQTSILINYMETNKSFNLLLNRQVKYSASSFEKEALNSIEERLKLLDLHLAEGIGNPDSLIYKKSILVDSSMKAWERALVQSKINPVLNIDQVTNALNANQCILEYFYSGNNIYLLLINKKNVIFKKIEVSQSNLDINEQLLKLGNYIEESSLAQDLSLKDYSQTASLIYNTLIEPVEDKLLPEVIIIPDANMSTLPWGALLTSLPNSLDCRLWPYWIKKNTLATQHSLSLWLAGSAIQQRNRISPIPISAYGPYFENLKYNIEECIELDKLIKGNLYLKEEATVKNFFDQAPQSKIIHISSHAKSNVKYEDSSSIQFEEGIIYGGEIEQHELSADLVFLSACETGIGKVITAEGVMSFARAFFNAGAGAVISTLWKINDQKSLDQVVQIYRNLIKGQSKNVAIRSMQLQYLKNVSNPKYAFPYYWAAYQCQGDLKPIFKISVLSTGYFQIALSVIGILGLCLFFKRK